MSGIKLKTAGGGSITLQPENTGVDISLTVPADNSMLVSASDLAASSGAAGVGYLPAGTGAVATTVQEQLRKILITTDKAVDLSGASNSGSVLRSLISEAAAGSTVIFKAGTYLVDRDGTNTWCLHINKKLHLIFEPGVVIKASAPCRSVIRVSATITSDGSPIIDGDYKTNHAVELIAGASGTTLRKWEGKQVTQQYDSSYSAAVFVVVSETGVTFDECYAHDAIAYPNAVIGDAAGTSRGFHFYGTVSTYGVNAVINSRVKNIVNTNGLAGDYEDEDGIVAQMTGSFTLIDNNVIIDCMKRGIKAQESATISNNTVISTRTGAIDSVDGALRMFAGISVYGENTNVVNNTIAGATTLGYSQGGTFYYGIDAGVTGQQKLRITITNNTLKIGTLSNSRGVEFIRLWGCLSNLIVSDNRLSFLAGPTSYATFGIRADFDHTTLYASVLISENVIESAAYPAMLRGGFSGYVSANQIYGITGGSGGIAVEPSASALRPKNVTFNGNCGYNSNEFTVRVTDTGAVGIHAVGNKTASTFRAAVSIADGIRSFEDCSFGEALRPARYYGSAPPTLGSWVRGDSAMNNDPKDSAPVVEWRCLYSGTPGTWRAASWLTIRGTTASRPSLTASDAGVQYFDTTLDPDGKPIWWTGTAWVDATGATV